MITNGDGTHDDIVYRLVNNNKIVGYELRINGQSIYSYDGDTFDKSIAPIKHDQREIGSRKGDKVYVYEGDIYMAKHSVDDSMTLVHVGNLHDNAKTQSMMRKMFGYGIDILFFSWLLLMVVQTIINWGVK